MEFVSLNHPKLTLAGAEAILAAAKAHAAHIAVPMNVAVVDDGGHLIAFLRMDGAKLSSIDVAIAKAHSAATSRRPTGPARTGDELQKVLLSLALAIASQAQQTPIRGGLPLEADGQCVGTIGVSAGTEDQDVEVAMAGVAALGK